MWNVDGVAGIISSETELFYHLCRAKVGQHLKVAVGIVGNTTLYSNIDGVTGDLVMRKLASHTDLKTDVILNWFSLFGIRVLNTFAQRDTFSENQDLWTKG